MQGLENSSSGLQNQARLPSSPDAAERSRLRVVVAEDCKESREILRHLLGKWDFDLHIFGDSLQAWDFVQSEDVPALVILAWVMPQMDGLQFTYRARRLNRKHYLYILLLTGKEGTESVLEGLRAGADDYLAKPFDPAVIGARLFVAERILGFQRNLFAAKEQLAALEERYRNLMEETPALICTHDLDGKLLTVSSAAARAFGYTVDECIGRNIRDVLITEAQPGFDLYLEQIRRNQVASGHMELVTRTRRRLIWSYTNRLIQGAVPYVLGHAQDVTERIQMRKALRKSQEEALAKERKLSRTDALTGLANRRAFFEIADSERKRAERYNRPLSLAYIDLDNFKQVNDQQGHETGDQVLTLVGQIVGTNLRADSRAARLGGDEFVLLLPEMDHQAACLVIARLQKLLNAAMQERNWPITCSIGMVTFNSAAETTEAIVHAADQLMYQVKRQGKNHTAALVIDREPLHVSHLTERRNHPRHAS